MKSASISTGSMAMFFGPNVKASIPPAPGKDGAMGAIVAGSGRDRAVLNETAEQNGYGVSIPEAILLAGILPQPTAGTQYAAAGFSRLP
jgi:hypothetical protein